MTTVADIEWGRRLARALVGVDHNRMLSLVLDELPEEDVRALAVVLLAAEHPRYTETPEDVFGNSTPQPDSLTRVARLQGVIDRVEVTLSRPHREAVRG